MNANKKLIIFLIAFSLIFNSVFAQFQLNAGDSDAFDFYKCAGKGVIDTESDASTSFRTNLIVSQTGCVSALYVCWLLGHCGAFVALNDVFEVFNERVSPVLVNFEETLNFSFNIRNNSANPETASYTVSVLDTTNQPVSGFSQITQSTSSIAPGANVIETVSFTADQGTFAAGKQYIAVVLVSPGPNEENIANNRRTQIFSVGGQQFSPISVPDNSLALLPLIALIVVGIVLFKK